MTNRNPEWQLNFRRPVVVECKNDFCHNPVTTITAAIHQGVYCPICIEEAKRLWKRRYDDKRKVWRREETRKRKATT